MEALRHGEVQSVLGALHEAGVAPLILKGTALAYCLYPAPHERPRIDTDLFLRSEDVDRAWEVFRARGYARAAQNTGRLVSHQFACARTDEHGIWHAFDLHWKLANPQVFANLISYDLLASRAVPVPSLGPHARVPARVDLLVIACLHQAAHHPEHLRLIWTLDVHLLAGSLGDGRARATAARRPGAGAGHDLRYGLRIAQRWLGTAIPQQVLDDLESVDPRSEPAARYVSHVSRLDNLLVDLRQLPGWRDRMRLIIEHAFPPTEYMLRRYNTTRRAWLPALYAHRLVAAAGAGCVTHDGQADSRGQARARHPAVGRRSGRIVAALAAAGRAHQARGRRPGLLLAGTRRRGRARVPRVQVPIDDSRRRARTSAPCRPARTTRASRASAG